MKKRLLSVLLSFAVFAGNAVTPLAAGDYDTEIEIMDESFDSVGAGEAFESDQDDIQIEIVDESSDEEQEYSSDEASFDGSDESDFDEEIVIIDSADDKEDEAEYSSSSMSMSSQETDLLTESTKVEKENLPLDQMWETFSTLKEGEDYEKDELISIADSEEDAREIAAAYDGTLKSYEYGVATIDLSESKFSVGTAFEKALDTDLDYPMAEPNYIIAFEEMPEDIEAGFNSTIPMLRKSAWEVQYYDNGHNDPFLNPDNVKYQWHHDTIDTYRAWGATIGRPEIVVAVIDSGVNANHEDLAANILDVSDEIDLNGNRNMDNVGHGTHVAGIVAASIDNNAGGGGVAPGVRVMPICVSNGSGGASTDYMVKAVQYVAGATEKEDGSLYYTKRRADIINMSIGTKIYSASLKEAIDHAYASGVTYVASMGNSYANVISYPAYLDHVIAVGATNQAGESSSYSNVGSWADILAPGDSIYSTYWYRFNPEANNLYASLSGTSMASPVVAGACALYMSAFGHVDPDTMERVLKSCAEKGIVNIANMLDTDSTPPAIGIYANDATKDSDYTALGIVSDGKTYTLPYNVAPDSILTFGARNYSEETADSTNNKIIYTTDGESPSVVDGVIKKGTFYDGNGIYVMNLCGILTAPKKLTIKARTVTGTGVISKVTTLIFTIDPSMQSGTVDENLDKDLAITIVGAPRQMVAGKTITLKATVSPVTSKIKPTWKIISYSDGDLSKAKITSEGTLTTNANQHGILTVGCYSSDGRVYDKVDIEVISTIYPVKTLTIPSKINMTFDPTIDDGGAARKTIKISKLIDTKNNDILGDDTVSFSWTSSNSEVVEVSAKDINSTSAKIVARGVGTARIVCKALDGSNKSATCTVKVTGEKIVKSVIAVPVTESEDYDITYKQSGSVKEVALSVNPEITLTAIQSDADKVLENVADPVWSCSNNKILMLEPSGKDVKITGLSKGSATVKCTARDGSEKSCEFTVKVKKVVTDIEISGQYYVAPGASAPYKATILPADANDKSVTWSVVNAKTKKAVEGVRIGNSGNLSVAKTVKTGTMLLIKAVAKDKGHFAATYTVEVLTKATKVKVTSPSASPVLYLGATSKAASGYSNSVEIVAKADNYTELTFKSSDPKMLILGESSFDADTGKNKVTVTGFKKGSGTITVKTLDGSDKKATINVKVKQLVTGLSVTGQDYIAAGKQATFKATCDNSDANDKTVTWSLSGKGEGVTVNPKNGQVQVAKDASGGSFRVVAIANDGSGISASKKFTVTQAKATAVKLATNDSYSERKIYKVSRDKNDKLISFQLTDVDIDGQLDDDERDLTLAAEITGSSASTVTWKSSNTKVAKVSSKGVVKAVSKGSATITGTVNDGSGKSASVKVTVITPASGLEMIVADKQLNKVAYGKSATLKPVLQDAYGKPSVKAVSWDYNIVAVTKDSYEYFGDEVNAELKKKKAFFKFADGKVTVNSLKDYMKNYETYCHYLKEFDSDEFGIEVLVYATDGTGYGYSRLLTATNPATTIDMYPYPLKTESQKITKDTVTLDGYSESGTRCIYSGDQFYYRYKLVSDGLSAYTVSSNKPEVASACCDDNDQSIFYIYPYKKGNVEVTLKARDGSGKTVKFKFTILETKPSSK